MKRIYEAEAYRREVGSYWETTVPVPQWPKADGDVHADAAIIGAGYTGMNAALELAEVHGVSVVLVDAVQPGWGASGRNGGFACMGGSALPWKAIRKRFGDEETRRFFAEQSAAIGTVRDNLDRYNINADTHSNGEVQLAHSAKAWQAMQEEAASYEEFFGVKTRLIAKSGLAPEGLASDEFHGAAELPLGFALNPMKYSAGLANAVQANPGIQAFGDSPVERIVREGNKWRLIGLNGTVTAEKLLIATNGYSSEDVPPWLAGKLLPVLTQILVTEPLSDEHLSAQGWTSNQMSYDSRSLLHYFRLMPGNGKDGPRMMFGMRGGVSARHAAKQRMQKVLRQDFERMFPAWRDVETPYCWSGFACLSASLLPYAGPVPEMENTYAALAWHGNGVALGSHAGRRIAAIMAGLAHPESLPAPMRQIPKRFPLPFLRRASLSALYGALGIFER